MMTTKITRLALLLIFVCVSAFAQSSDVNLLLSTLPAGKDPQRYKGYVEPQFKAVTQRSLYLTMRDGVKIAVTVVLPKDLPADKPIPAILAWTPGRRAKRIHTRTRLCHRLRRRARHRGVIRRLESTVQSG